jgi:thymidylate synthase
MVRHEKDGQDYLDVSVDIRSWDYITAGAINQIQYIIFAEMVARHLGYTLANVRFSIANLQIYDRHMEIAEMLCKKTSIPMNPRIVFDTNETDFFKNPLNSIKIQGYDGKLIDSINPQVKIPVAV